MKIPFLDLSIKKPTHINQYLKLFKNTLVSGKFVMGPDIINLEALLAKFCNRKYCVSVGSGTEALFLAIKSLNFDKNDEIITTSLSWIATANAIHLNGLTPVFADIDEDLNISPKSINKLITNKTKAILIVNFTGKICEIEEIEKICKENKIYLIEDCAQSFGAVKNKRKSGSFGVISAFSFNPMKVYGAFGEAGAVLTDNKRIYDKLIYLRYNGTKNKEFLVEPSLNCRMDTIQATFLIEKLKYVNQIIKQRNKFARKYNENLRNIVKIPKVNNNEIHTYYTYTILCERRNKLKLFLQKKGIETQIQHPILMPLQKPYKIFKKDISIAKFICNKILSIPIHENLKNYQINYIIKSIKEFYN